MHVTRWSRWDFRAALAAEAQRKAAGSHPSWLYRERGLYFAQLSRYYARFPAEQIAVFLYDDLVAAPVELTQSIYRFLGVDTSFVPTIERYNAGGILRAAAACWPPCEHSRYGASPHGCCR